MPERSRNRPRDVNKLNRQLVDEATGEQPKPDPDKGMTRPPSRPGAKAA